MTIYNESIVEKMTFGNGAESRGEFWQTRSLTQLHAEINMPDNYWAADLGKVICPQGYGAQPYGLDGYGLGTVYTYDLMVCGGTYQYITLSEALPNNAPQDSIISINKDNMKKDSFQYYMIPIAERFNKVRVKYVVRNEKYVDDIVEVDNQYDIDTYEQVRPHVYDLTGIKRETQARRMVQYLSDYNRFIDWKCQFDTDILGLMTNLGSIIGITHPVPGWTAKLFRITSLGEAQEFEASIKCTEYNSDVYNDYSNSPVDKTPDYAIDKYQIPSAVRNFAVYEDHYSPVLYFAYSTPEIPTNYFAGALIYKILSNGTYEALGPAYCSTASCVLLNNIGLTDSMIYFDPNSVVGSFPESGKFWIGNEMISYLGIDDTGCFLNCERGIEDSISQSWSSGEICTLFQDSLFTYSYDQINDTGSTLTFKAVAFTSYGVNSGGQTAPELIISVHGYALSTPYPIGDPRIQEF